MSVTFYSNCGVYLARTGSHERAIHLFLKARKAAGECQYIPLLVNILLCSFRLGRYDDCLQCLDDIESQLESGGGCISPATVMQVRTAIYAIVKSRRSTPETTITPHPAQPTIPISCMIDTVTLSSVGFTNIPRSHSFTSKLKSPERRTRNMPSPKPSRIPTVMSASTAAIYPYERLVSSQAFYPRNVSVVEREKHLGDVEFRAIFGMTKKAFAELPEWRRVQKKQECKLF